MSAGEGVSNSTSRVPSALVGAAVGVPVATPAAGAEVGAEVGARLAPTTSSRSFTTPSPFVSPGGSVALCCVVLHILIGL